MGRRLQVYKGERLMEKNALKYKAIKVIVLVFILNVISITIYCTFFLNKSVSFGIETLKTNTDKSMEEIISNIEENGVSSEKIEILASDYDVEISLKDVDNNIVFDNIKNHNFYYDNSKIIEIDNLKYILQVSKELDVSVSSIIISLMYLELTIMLIISSISIYIVNKKLLRPITNLSYDMKSYKYGTLPKRREQKTAVDELQNDFIDLTEALEAEKEKKSQIIASISHDIKTPLTTILGYTARLENAELTDAVKEKYIAKINNKAVVIKELMNDFDDYLGSNIKGNIHKESITTKELFKDLRNDYEEDLFDKGIKLKLLNNAKREELVIDINKIKRVFSNIINNSIRHIKENGEIRITLNSKSDSYEFIISDNGEGVKEEDIKRIFDPLFTTDPSRKISGLGLSICSQIIKLHGGSIYAKNNLKGGLSIYFTIKDSKE